MEGYISLGYGYKSVGLLCFCRFFVLCGEEFGTGFALY